MAHSVEQIRDQIISLLPRLRRFARTVARNVHDADDLVQITVERALVRHAQWQPDSRLDSWLFGIMRNAWIDETRARTRRARVLAPQETGEHVGASPMDAQMQAMSIQAALQQLPEEQRMAIGLVLVEGLSYKEASGVLEVPIGTLTSRLARGREALQAILGEGSAAAAGGAE